MRQEQEHNINNDYYLKKAQEIGKIGAWDLDLMNNKLYWTDQSYEIFGIPQGTALTYHLFLEVVHPDDRELVHNSWQAALEGAAYDIVHRIIADGTVKWVREKAEIEFNSDGIPVRAIGVTQDISDQKAIEEKLKKNQYYLEKAQEIGKLGTWDEDLVSKKFVWTQETYRIYEIPEGTELNYDLFFERVHPEDIEFVEKSWNEALQGKPYDIQHRILVNGKVKWLNEKAEFEYDHNGDLVRIIGVAQDITDIMEMTNKLKDAQKRAEESNKLKSAFLANVSHEIRTPLNGILGFAQLLRSETFENQEKANRYLDIIQASGDNLLNILNDIIDISKIEANQLDLNAQTMDVHKVLNDAHLIMEQNLKRSGKNLWLNLSLGTDAEQLLIISDPSRLQQIVLNLLSNAIKFTEKGGIDFGYTISEDEKELTFFVHDSGKGIAEEDLPRIFRRFEQIDPTDQNGTGLGLAISRSIVELMGGKLKVSSEPGVGTKFSVMIPLKKASSAQIFQSQHKNEAIDLNGKKVLVVDDNRINCMFLSETLKKDGIVVTKAHSGEEAIEKCENDRFDIILMDINMKGMNGYEAMSFIRKKNPEVPFIVQTGYAMSEEKQRAISNGAVAYISKPINVQLLKQLISEHIE